MNQTDLKLYKPKINIQDFLGFNENLPDNELTFAIFKNLTIARKVQDAAFIAIGRMLKIVRDKKLFKYLDYENFTQFLASEELSFSREKAYLYIRIYERFIENLGLSQEDVTKLGVVRLMLLAPLIKDMEKDEALAKITEVQELRYNDFVKNVKSTVNKDGKPNVFWNEEISKWNVQFFDNKTNLVSLGDFDAEEQS